MKTCTCEDWEPNIKIINGYIDMAANRVYGDKKGYTGKYFSHCPWCGKMLEEESVMPKIKAVPIKKGMCI